MGAKAVEVSKDSDKEAAEDSAAGRQDAANGDDDVEHDAKPGDDAMESTSPAQEASVNVEAIEETDGPAEKPKQRDVNEMIPFEEISVSTAFCVEVELVSSIP